MSMDEDRLREIIFDLMSRNRIPGVSLSIVKQGEPVFMEGFGSRDLERGLPATPNTLYGIGSVTKSFTALAIMKLVEEGLLSPEDPVDKYLDLRLRPRGEPVRIWHLLTHSPGMPSLAFAELLIARLLGKADPLLPIETIDDLILYANRYAGDAVARPGDRYFYFNTGYTLLGRIIEKVSGEKYSEFVEKRILGPLGMNRSTFSRERFLADPDRMTPYLDTEKGIEEAPFPFHGLMEAAGGLASSVAELSNYLKMYLLREETIVDRKTLEEMLKPRVKIPSDTGLGEQYYAYGWTVSTGFKGHRLVSHGGNIAVSSAYLGFIPDAGIGVALLSNTGKTLVLRRIGLAALALQLGLRPEDVPGWREEELLDRLTGIYESRGGVVRARVTRARGALIVEERTQLSRQTHVLVPEKLDPRNPVFYAPTPEGRQYMDFIVEDDRVVFLMERYRLEKISDLAGEWEK